MARRLRSVFTMNHSSSSLVALHSVLVAGALALTGGLTGCKGADAAPAPATTGAPSAPAAAAPPVVEAPAPPPDPTAGLVPFDLAPGGKLWAPYTIKAPAGAKLTKSFSGPLIELGEWAIVVSFTDTRFSSTEADLNTGIGYGVKWKSLEKTADLFEYTTFGQDGGKPFERFSFHMLVKTDGKTFGCSSGSVKAREDLGPLKAACRTLAKK